VGKSVQMEWVPAEFPGKGERVYNAPPALPVRATELLGGAGGGQRASSAAAPPQRGASAQYEACIRQDKEGGEKNPFFF
jgi:hypothetical protein